MAAGGHDRVHPFKRAFWRRAVPTPPSPMPTRWELLVGQPVKSQPGPPPPHSTKVLPGRKHKFRPSSASALSYADPKGTTKNPALKKKKKMEEIRADTLEVPHSRERTGVISQY